MSATLFEMDPRCPECGGSGKVFDPKLGVQRSCKACASLSNPDEDTIGKFQRPGDAAETQRTSAVAFYPKSGTARRKTLDAITASGNWGMTDEEMQLSLRMNSSTQRPRRVELVEGHWIEDSGRRRKTRSGRLAVIWVLTERGRAAIG